MKMKKIIVIITSVLLVLAMSSMLCVFAADKVTFDAEQIKLDYLTNSYSTEKEKLSSMTAMMTEGDYTLYLEPRTAEMALLNNETGQTLWSNPYDASGQLIADTQKCELMSQILLNYTTISTGASSTMNSFEEAAMRINADSGINQISIKPVSGGVRVEYTMGRTETRVLVPRLISADRFNECILNPLKDAAKQHLKTTDGVTAEFLLSKFYNSETGNTVFYSLKDPDGEGVTERQKRAMYLQYPITEKMPVYVIDSGATQVELVNWLEKAITNFTDYTFEDMAYDHSLTNYTGTDVAPPLFRVAIEYYLDENGLTYRVPANGIRFDASLYRLTDITVLPYLGAGTASGGGYTVIPDGSGAIIDFNDVKDTSVTLGGKIYGSDYSYYSISGANQEIMRLPVFGVVSQKSSEKTITTKKQKTDENGEPMFDENGEAIMEVVKEVVNETQSYGVLSIIEEGEAIGSIYTKHGGAVNPYNTTYATYVPRPNDSYALNQFSAASTSMWTVVTDRRYTGNITVKVMMFDGTDADYAGMANAYRQYLTDKEVLKKIEKPEEKLPLFIESFGAIEVTERVCGVPVNVKKKLTTYDDLQTMVTELHEAGVGKVDIKYQSWANDAFRAKPFTKLSLEKATGGKSGLKKFLQFAEENNAALYPDVELTYVYYISLFDGFNYNKMISRKVDKRMATKLEYDDQFQGFMTWAGDVISPQFMSTIWGKIEKKYTKLGIGGVSVGNLTSDLNSDQSKKRPLNRVEAQGYVSDVLAQIKETAGKVMGSGGNAYTLSNLDLLVNAPTESSHYIYASKEIPFYGMVVHGSLQFSGEPINAAPDYNKAILKTIENGAIPFFRVSYENTNELKSDISTSKYFSVDYQIWKKDMIEAYKEVNEALADLQDKYITDHESIGEKTVCVTYENGVQIFVNYDRDTVYVYRDKDGKLATTYKFNEKSGKAVVDTAAKDELGLDTVVEVEHDLILKLEGNSYVKRGDK